MRNDLIFPLLLRNILDVLTQFTTGGSNDADIATPINGPFIPCSNANATPDPDVKAQATPIHNERAFPLEIK